MKLIVGALALALLADLCARGMQPAGLFAFSPWTDLAMTGDSLTTNEGRDPLLPVRRMPDLVSNAPFLVERRRYALEPRALSERDSSNRLPVVPWSCHTEHDSG